MPLTKAVPQENMKSLGRTPFKWRSAHGLYKVLNYSYVLFPLTLSTMFYFSLRLAKISGYYKFIVAEDGDWNWSTVACVLCNIIYILAQLPPYASVFGLCLPMRPFRYSRAPRRRTFQTLNVCLVTKGTNFETVLNSTRIWKRVKDVDYRVRFYIVVDDGRGTRLRESLPSFIQVTIVPETFFTKRAKYKARALEYFRQTQQLNRDDWVLHLDEESMIDEAVIKSCLDFIERGDEVIGMGTIHYNAVNHWRNSLLSAAEVVRMSEDFGRFQLPVRLFRRPLLGWMHGSWILINGEVENRVTWETACVAEDFWFAYNAVALGYKSGWLHAIVREQPPETMRDFFRQRRRWYTGILSIESYIVRLVLVASVSGEVGFFLVPLYTLMGGSVFVPRWMFLWLLWNFVTDTHVLMVASIIQDVTTPDISVLNMVENAIKSVLLAPFVHLLQAGSLLSCFLKPAQGFEVIKKS